MLQDEKVEEQILVGTYGTPALYRQLNRVQRTISSAVYKSAVLVKWKHNGEDRWCWMKEVFNYTEQNSL